MAKIYLSKTPHELDRFGGTDITDREEDNHGCCGNCRYHLNEDEEGCGICQCTEGITHHDDMCDYYEQECREDW